MPRSSSPFITLLAWLFGIMLAGCLMGWAFQPAQAQAYYGASPPSMAFACNNPYTACRPGPPVYQGGGYQSGGYYNGGFGYIQPSTSRATPGSASTTGGDCSTIFNPTDHNPRQLANGAMMVFDSNGVKGAPKRWHVVEGTGYPSASGMGVAVTNNCGATAYATSASAANDNIVVSRQQPSGFAEYPHEEIRVTGKHR